MSTCNYQPQKPSMKEQLKNLLLDFVDWLESDRVNKIWTTALWIFLTVSLAYIIIKTVIDLRTGYTPTL